MRIPQIHKFKKYTWLLNSALWTKVVQGAIAGVHNTRPMGRMRPAKMFGVVYKMILKNF